MSAPRSVARALIIVAIVVLAAMIAGSMVDFDHPYAWPDDLGDGIAMFAQGVLGIAVGLLVACAIVVGVVLLATLGVIGVGLLLIFVVGGVLLAVLGALIPLVLPVALIALVVWLICRDKRRAEPVSAQAPQHPG